VFEKKQHKDISDQRRVNNQSTEEVRGADASDAIGMDRQTDGRQPRDIGQVARCIVTVEHR